MITLSDRAAGCIVGGAIGDAMGGPYEGMSGPISIDPDAAWNISDDTQLTLATCEAIVRDGRVIPESVARRFLVWYRARHLSGTGASTLKALRDLDAGAHWALSGRKGEMAAGNGAAMRAAPLAFCLDPSCQQDRATIRDVCWITHQSDEAYAGALAVVAAIRCVVQNGWDSSSSLTASVAATLPDSNVRDNLESLAGRFPDAPVSEIAASIGCSAYAAESVPLAIFASQRTKSGFREMLHETIRAGGDTDTIASIAGQIAGARMGLARLQEELPGSLTIPPDVIEAASGFAAVVGSST